MTFATEAAREGIELRALRGVITTEVDQSRALGVESRACICDFSSTHSTSALSGGFM